MNELIIPSELKELSLCSRAFSYTIENEQDVIGASHLLSEFAEKKKLFENLREMFIRPIKRVMAKKEEEIREAARPFEEADQELRKRIAKYMDRSRAEKIRLAEIEKQKQIESQKEKIEELTKVELITGEKSILAPLVQANISALENMDINDMRQSVRTPQGMVSQSLVWKWEVQDSSLIPRDFFIVDEKKIETNCKSGQRDVPGIRYWQESRVSVK